MAEKFIGLEDEILLRRAVRQAYKHEGMVGIYRCMGELTDSLRIVGEVAKEILEENK